MAVRVQVLVGIKGSVMWTLGLFESRQAAVDHRHLAKDFDRWEVIGADFPWIRRQ